MSDTSWRLHAFERLIATTPTGIAVLRLSAEDEAIIDLIDPGTSAAFGRDADELVGRRVTEVYPQPDASQVIAQLRRARDDGEVSYETVRDLPSGRRTARVRVLPIGDDRYLMLARDISSEREAARRIEQLERVAGIGLYHWNAKDDRLEWSDQLYRMFGYAPGEVEMTLERFLGHVHPDDRAEQERLIVRARDEAETVTTAFRLVGADGAERTIEVRAEAASENGRLLYAFGTMQDVSGTLHLERQAEQLRRGETRRRTGLEVNDRIVQGLCTAWLSLQLGNHAAALEAVQSTTANAQGVVRDLLADLLDTDEDIGPGDLVSHVPGEVHPKGKPS